MRTVLSTISVSIITMKTGTKLRVESGELRVSQALVRPWQHTNHQSIHPERNTVKSKDLADTQPISTEISPLRF